MKKSIFFVSILLANFHVVLAFDDDGDGMSDVWEKEFEVETSFPDGDEDGDMISNF